ncbi:MAG: sigma-70 family RNA polymerase sigma factor [Verrucomicrobiota bacterium]
MVMMEDVADSHILVELEPGTGPVTICHDGLDLEPDDGLVTFMAFQATDKELALKACDELHRRHARFLLAWCIKNRLETFGEAAEGFVNATFLKAYQVAEKFVCTDKSARTEQVLAWLFRIMKNLYLDSLRAEKRRPVVRCTDEETERLEDIEEKRQEAADQVPTGRKAAVLAFLETLPPKDREILTATAEFWDLEKGESVIDDDVREGICREYGLTESSLRVRRKRLRDRAKSFIQERTKETI